MIHLLWLFSAAEVTIKWLQEPSINQSSHNLRIYMTAWLDLITSFLELSISRKKDYALLDI